jgi:hypothetical protein
VCFDNAAMSILDRIAKAIVDDAEARGVLRPGMTLIEATAGNISMGLALVAAVRGYQLVCAMPEMMSIDKRVALEPVMQLVGGVQLGGDQWLTTTGDTVNTASTSEVPHAHPWPARKLRAVSQTSRGIN